MKRLSLIGAWMVVLILTTTFTWQIVSSADDRISERPISPLNVGAPAIGTTAGTFGSPSPTSPNVGTTNPIENTTTTGPAETITTAQRSVKTVQTEGGNVVLWYRPNEVVLQAATPAPGFQATVVEAGPLEVEVSFESETVEVSVQAEWVEGDLEVVISTSAEE